MKTTIIAIFSLLLVGLFSCTNMRVNLPGDKYGPSDRTMSVDLNRLRDGIAQMPKPSIFYTKDGVKIKISKQAKGYVIYINDNNEQSSLNVTFDPNISVDDYRPYLLDGFSINRKISLFMITKCQYQWQGKSYSWLPDYSGNHNGEGLINGWIASSTTENREALDAFLDKYMYPVEEAINSSFSNIVFAN